TSRGLLPNSNYPTEKRNLPAKSTKWASPKHPMCFTSKPRSVDTNHGSNLMSSHSGEAYIQQYPRRKIGFTTGMNRGRIRPGGEMADTHGLGPCAFGREGSSPSLATMNKLGILEIPGFYK